MTALGHGAANQVKGAPTRTSQSPASVFVTGGTLSDVSVNTDQTINIEGDNLAAEDNGQLQKTAEVLQAILIELRVHTMILAEGLNIQDVDSLRNDAGIDIEGVL
jgi:hypothetical protein